MDAGNEDLAKNSPSAIYFDIVGPSEYIDPVDWVASKSSILKEKLTVVDVTLVSVCQPFSLGIEQLFISI